jgi:hypothetical protein
VIAKVAILPGRGGRTAAVKQRPRISTCGVGVVDLLDLPVLKCGGVHIVERQRCKRIRPIHGKTLDALRAEGEGNRVHARTQRLGVRRFIGVAGRRAT